MDRKQTPKRDSRKAPQKNSEREPREWTLMFYFASDNLLAPGIVSQLKAIKDAGFHKQVNVIARFDPHTTKTPTHVFDVNLGEKILSRRECSIGFTANDPYVRTLVGDKLWSNEQNERHQLIRDRIKAWFEESGYTYDPPKPRPTVFTNAGKNGNHVPNKFTGEPDPNTSLKDFLRFCAREYPARHYMLFILGHGIVVGNDLFLYDEHSNKEHALKLKELRVRLEDFVSRTRNTGTLELISFHSCSMSSLEVAYELRDTAKYMLASQGPAFVGSWPYKPILIRVFNDVKKNSRGANIKPAQTIRRIFDYCFYNSYDFQLAGYSFDVCLTDLSQMTNDSENGIKAALKDLSDALIAGLPPAGPSGAQQNGHKLPPGANPAVDLIILSHWEAQSYYEENFTDLWDFCFCLYRRCLAIEKTLAGKIPESIGRIKNACYTVLGTIGPYNIGKSKVLKPNSDISPIAHSGFAGPTYQYSHGLSIYFPWSLPEDSEMWTTEYEKYELSADTGNCWREFLKRYFEATMRQTRAEEYKAAHIKVPELDFDGQLLEEISGVVFNEFGQLKDGPWDKTGGKDTKVDPTGEECVCPSIKNYPPITRGVPASPSALRKFKVFK